mmetsp:Transcript_9716/g.18408  ORF Transcript_9716/g.18408 Transcript_9716/m.18408 type:complete len:232 (+) Transcript_9716:962-1657(+)
MPGTACAGPRRGEGNRRTCARAAAWRVSSKRERRSGRGRGGSTARTPCYPRAAPRRIPPPCRNFVRRLVPARPTRPARRYPLPSFSLPSLCLPCPSAPPPRLPLRRPPLDRRKGPKPRSGCPCGSSRRHLRRCRRRNRGPKRRGAGPPLTASETDRAETSLFTTEISECDCLRVSCARFPSALDFVEGAVPQFLFRPFLRRYKVQCCKDAPGKMFSASRVEATSGSHFSFL